MKKVSITAICGALAMPLANADIFSSRNAAMGGAGVAVSDYEVAGLYNPALLTVKEEKDSVAIVFPNVGAEVSDQDEIFDELDAIADDFDALEQAIAASAPNASTDPTVQSIRDRLIGNLNFVSDKPVSLNLGAFMSVAVPGDEQGFGIAVSGFADVLVEARYDDANDTPLIDAAILGNVTDFDTVSLNSNVKAIGVAVAEVIFSYARSVSFGDREVSIGVSPKYQSVETIQYIQTVNNYDEDDFDAEEFTDDDSGFNMDIGAAMNLNDKTLIAVNIQNLFGADYDTVEDPVTSEMTTYEIRPVVTPAISHKRDWLAATAELDLTERSGFKDEDGSQFFRVGVEFDAANWAQLRLGYRSDMNSVREDVVSAGIGLSPFDVLHIGIAGFVGDNDTAGASFDLKLTL